MIKNKYKICVYAICKNEANFVEKWMKSMGEADAVFVTDTGSEDDTVKLLRQMGATVFEAKVEPWRFDTARNISLDNVPDNFDICLCTDLDELLSPGWRALIEEYWRPETTAGRYLYNWSVHADGTPDVQFYYTKLHLRKGYRWKHPIHECIQALGAHRVTDIPGMVLTHYPDTKKARGSYLKLLELAVFEEPENDRMAFYLGREYKYKGMWRECVAAMERYLKLNGATWQEERCAAMRFAAYSLLMSGDYGGCKKWFFRAIAEAPHMREPYVEFAQAAYSKQDWPLCFAMIEQALKLDKRVLSYVTMGYAWDHTPYDLAAIAWYNEGFFQKSANRAAQALHLKPQSLRLKRNLKFAENKLLGK